MIREPFDMPEEMLIDPSTGLSLNIPLSYQVGPEWFELFPAKYALLQKMREEQGIIIDDFPEGPAEKTTNPSMADTLARLQASKEGTQDD